ncbi:hypothetical protein BDV06DRAFT_193183 [Aspergillus oleicola]
MNTTVSSPKKPLDIIITGGSLTALMHGTALHRLGHNIHILEQSPTPAPTSHLAGIVPSPHAIAFLDRFDRAADTPLGFSAPPSRYSRYLYSSAKGSRLMTSWGALYYRLRANFDGLRSDYIPHPPDVACLDGESLDSARSRAVYESGQRVIDVKESGGNGKVIVVVQDIALEHTRILSTDLVLAADGANSTIRKILCGGTDYTSRRYAGYVAWRGVVPESIVSKETIEFFAEYKPHATTTAEYGQAVAYIVPGLSGSLSPGTRNINFVWYFKIPPSSLPAVMTDKHGHNHRTTVPQGLLHPAVWSAQVSLGASILPPPYAEILSKIPSPFLHTIADTAPPPRASFLNDRVLLVGDALTLLRPHIGYSTSMAALEANLTERLVTGEIGLQEWEGRVLAMAYLHYYRGIRRGHDFLKSAWTWRVFSAVQYWASLAWYWGLARFVWGGRGLAV